MNFISIDYGFKYLGIALGNLFNKNILPLIIIKNNFFFYFILKKIILKFYIKFILIGFALNFKNLKSYLELIFLLKKFIIKINNLYNIKIFLINEDYSSYIFIKRLDNLSASNFIKIFYTRR